MPTHERLALAERMKEARLATALRHKAAVSQTEMARLAGKELGRAMHQNQWSRYETAKEEPPLDVIRVAAKLSGLTESYLAFGSRPPAAAPQGAPAASEDWIDPERDRKLTEEELDRATRAAEKKAAERRASERRRRREKDA